MHTCTAPIQSSRFLPPNKAHTLYTCSDTRLSALPVQKRRNKFSSIRRARARVVWELIPARPTSPITQSSGWCEQATTIRHSLLPRAERTVSCPFGEEEEEEEVTYRQKKKRRWRVPGGGLSQPEKVQQRVVQLAQLVQGPSRLDVALQVRPVRVPEGRWEQVTCETLLLLYWAADFFFFVLCTVIFVINFWNINNYITKGNRKEN